MEVQKIEAHMSIQERKQLIVAQEEAWKAKGLGAANDSTQFTVAARMMKKGQRPKTSVNEILACAESSICSFSSGFTARLHQRGCWSVSGGKWFHGWSCTC